jgi:hypothetical protein
MDSQLIVVYAIIALAAAFLVVREVRSWLGSAGGCNGGCGCAKAVELPRNGRVPLRLIEPARTKKTESA